MMAETTPGACCIWPRPAAFTPMMRRSLATLLRIADNYPPDPTRTVDVGSPTYRLLVAGGYAEVVSTHTLNAYRRGGGHATVWRLTITDKGRTALARGDDDADHP